MPVTDRDRASSVGPFETFADHVRPDGVVARWESRRHRKHLHSATGRKFDMVGARGPRMVDRGSFRRGIAAFRARRRPRVRNCRRSPLGRVDFLYRLAVLHRGRVSDLPGGRGCRTAAARGAPAALLRLPAPQDRLVGDRGAAGRNPLLQCQHRERGAGGPHRRSREPARMAPRCRRLDLLPGRQPAGLAGGLPRLARLAARIMVVVDHAGQPDRVYRLRRVGRRRATSTRRPASCTTPSGRTWVPSSALSASWSARCCCCPNAPRKPALH